MEVKVKIIFCFIFHFRFGKTNFCWEKKQNDAQHQLGADTVGIFYGCVDLAFFIGSLDPLLSCSIARQTQGVRAN